MFDHLHVHAYGKSAPLSEVAQVTLKSPTLAVINVYDPEVSRASRSKDVACTALRPTMTLTVAACYRRGLV